MRNYPCWKQIGITRDRYFELLHFCRQYQDWKFKAESLIGIRAIKAGGGQRGKSIGDPVAKAAEERERLMAKITMVEDCARKVGGGVWYAGIMQNVCYGKAYTYIDKTLLPTSNKNAFFKSRRDFFILLDEMKSRIEE